jgi:hypothetical protein
VSPPEAPKTALGVVAGRQHLERVLVEFGRERGFGELGYGLAIGDCLGPVPA